MGTRFGQRCSFVIAIAHSLHLITEPRSERQQHSLALHAVGAFPCSRAPPFCRVRSKSYIIASQRNQRMASAKKRIVECSAGRRIMKVCTDVETASDADHLYVMSASNSLLPGLVKIGRSKNPLQRAIDLQESQPYHIKNPRAILGLWLARKRHSQAPRDVPCRGRSWIRMV